MDFTDGYQSTPAVAKPSRLTIELLLLVFGAVFVFASWGLIAAAGPPQDPPFSDPAALDILDGARHDRVCPKITDRRDVALAALQTTLDAKGKPQQGRVYPLAAVIGPLLGGGYVADGLAQQQRLAGIPPHTPGWPFVAWQGWTLGPPPAVTSTIDAALCTKLHSLLVNQGVQGCILVGTPEGEILACVQNPSADITRLGQAEYRDQIAAQGRSSGISPLTNPWGWLVPPGSTIKPFLVAVARQKGIAPPSVLCHGYTTDFGRPLHCHQSHGGVDTYSLALADSCNTFFYALSQNAALDGNTLVSYASAAGLTNPSLAGARPAAAILPWAGAAPGTEQRALSFIGQGLSVSPLGLLSAYASVLYGGAPYWRLVRELDGKPVAYPKPTPVFDSAVVRAVKEDVRAVALMGTAQTSMRAVRAYHPLIKTGTAQVGGEQGSDSWTVGGFSVGDSQYLLCCLVRNWNPDQPRGQTIAAETIKIVARHSAR